MPRPIAATLDLAALRHNLGVVRQHAPRSRALAVIKADAYGHGLLRTARALSDADGFALLELEGAVRLRDAGFQQRIVLLEGIFEPRDVPLLTQYRLSTVVHNHEQIALLKAAPAGAALDVLLKLNSGMNRLGFSAAHAPLEALRSNLAVGEITLMTHFANADDARGVAWQLETIERLVKDLGFVRGVTLPRSFANSAAILRYPQTHGDWVRPGIMLYGSTPFADVPAATLGLKPVMTLTSAIIAVQSLKAGDTVGYGGTFTAQHAMRMGVVACGYADGYPRHAPNCTPVLVNGRRTGTVGRVSMDMLCVDLTALPDAGVGAPVELWGANNPVQDVAVAAGTVGYELLCAIAPRVPQYELST